MLRRIKSIIEQLLSILITEYTLKLGFEVGLIVGRFDGLNIGLEETFWVGFWDGVAFKVGFWLGTAAGFEVGRAALTFPTEAVMMKNITITKLKSFIFIYQRFKVTWAQRCITPVYEVTSSATRLCWSVHA